MNNITNTKWLDMFNNSRLLRVLRMNHTPKWLVLSLDMLIVVFTYISVTYFEKLMGDTEAFNDLFQFKAFLLLSIYLIMSLLYKTYKGVVRYSGIEDAFKLFIMVTSSVALLAFFSILSLALTGQTMYSYMALFIQGIMSFALLFLVRLMVKIAYASFVNSNTEDRKRVIILGSAVNSIVLANALKSEIGGHYLPIALLDLNGKEKGRIINGMPIIAFKEDGIEATFEKYNTTTLIFLATQMNLMKHGLADKFLNANIEILLLNQVEEFNGSDENQAEAISEHVHNIQIEDLLGREPIKTDNPTIENCLRGKVVLVTGAAGSIGSEIVRQVATFGARQIILFDQAETPMHILHLEILEKYPQVKVVPFIGDVRNKSRLEQVFHLHRPDFVYHAAAYKHVPMMERHPSEAVAVNVGGTKNVADLSLQYHVDKFVMISTDKAVNPTNVMGASKRIAEIYVQSLFFDLKARNLNHYTKFITTRFGNVLGSNGSVVPLFKDQIAKGGPVTVTHKDIIRYFMTIPEACNLVLEAGCMGEGGEIFIFDMGEPVRIYDLAKKMISLSGLRLGRDIEIVETGLRPGEKLYEELLNDREKTLPTYHQKIMIGKVRQYDYNQVVDAIHSMLAQANECETMNVVREMKIIVPEFISKNSIFENLDVHEEEEIEETI